MEEIIKFICGIFFLVFVWYFLRSITKTFSKINEIESNQEEILTTLAELRNELKELNKYNSERKL